MSINMSHLPHVQAVHSQCGPSAWIQVLRLHADVHTEPLLTLVESEGEQGLHG